MPFSSALRMAAWFERKPWLDCIDAIGGCRKDRKTFCLARRRCTRPDVAGSVCSAASDCQYEPSGYQPHVSFHRGSRLQLRGRVMYRRSPIDKAVASSEALEAAKRVRVGNPRYSRFGNLYSLSGVVHRLNRSPRICSAIQTVNNAVAMPNPNFSFQEKSPQCNFGLGSGTNEKPARSTSIAQSFDRSRNPNADTHSQVPTSTVSPYTACAPRSNRA